MRALVNDGATASRQEPPCTTPEELAKAVAAMPRIRPPEPAFTAPPTTSARRTSRAPTAARRRAPGRHASRCRAAAAPAAEPYRQGLKWAVSALLIAALGLGSWQLADALMDQRATSPGHRANRRRRTATTSADEAKPASRSPIKGAAGLRSAGRTGRRTRTSDQRPTTATARTYWQTDSYIDGPDFGRRQVGRRHHPRSGHDAAGQPAASIDFVRR